MTGAFVKASVPATGSSLKIGKKSKAFSDAGVMSARVTATGCDCIHRVLKNLNQERTTARYLKEVDGDEDSGAPCAAGL